MARALRNHQRAAKRHVSKKPKNFSTPVKIPGGHTENNTGFIRPRAEKGKIEATLVTQSLGSRCEATDVQIGTAH
jgi:hypothetical protein